MQENMLVCNDNNFFSGFNLISFGGGPSLMSRMSFEGEIVEMQNNGNNGNVKQSTTRRKPVNVRKEFPETWLWTEHVVK